MYEHHEKGTQMSHHEHPACKPSPATGFLATLRAFFPIQGSGAPSSGCIGASSYRHVRGTPAVLATMLGVLVASALAAAPPALAATGHGFKLSFNGSSSPAGAISGGPYGLGYDQATGDIWVSNPGAGIAVEAFNSKGEYVPNTASPGPLNGLGFLYGLAVDNTGGPREGYVYLADLGHNVVDVFEPSGTYLEQFTSNSAAGVAVGAAGTPDAGDVYVTSDGGNVVKVYNPLKGNEKIAEIGAGHLHEPNGVAVSPSGDIYVSNPLVPEVVEFNANGECVNECKPLDTGPSFGVTVDPGPGAGQGDVYVADKTYVAEYSPSGEPLGTFGGAFGEFGGLTKIYGVAADSATGEVFTGDAEQANVDVFDLGTAPAKPETLPATEPTATTVLLHGKLNPGGTKTSYRFTYGTDGTCAGAGETTLTSAGEGNAPIEESEELTGLTPNTTYTFCMVAESAFGAVAGDALTVKTGTLKPDIESLTSSNVLPFSARLEAIVNPENEKTTSCAFEYGPTTSYGQQAACEPSQLEGFPGKTLTASLTGLSPSTPYFYRLTVGNASGVSEGTGTFTTERRPPEARTDPPTGVTGTTATLNALLNPVAANEPSTYQFFYQQSTTECEGGQTTPETKVAGNKEEAASASLTGLLPSTQYTFCVHIRNEGGETGEGSRVTFTTAAEAPSVEGESFSDAGSTSMHVTAKVDAKGLLTTYFYEYGTTVAYGSRTPETGLGAANEYVAAPASIGNLQPDTTYHFRVVAVNEHGSGDGADATFTTLPNGLSGLPDGRGYEMVTPPGNENAEVSYPWIPPEISGGWDGLETELPVQAAADGNAIAYVASPTSGGNGSAGEGGGNQYVAIRAPEGGWTQTALDPTASSAASYQGFSSELSTGVLGSCSSNPPLTPGAPGGEYSVLYTRNIRDGSFSPLFTVTPPDRNQREFRTAKVQAQGGNAGGCQDLIFAGASANYEHLLFMANDALTGNAVDPGVNANDLYDSVGGRLTLVNVLPNGQTDPNATFGAPPLPWAVEDANAPNFSNVISANGSRIFWTDLNDGHLYVRENDTQPQSPLGPNGECTVATDACTVQIDATKGPGSGGEARYWAATADGSKVFFTDCARLTSNSTAVASGGCHEGYPVYPQALTPEDDLTGNDLYEYDVDTGHLTDLTVDAGDTRGADVEGVLGTSETSEGGAYVYFVARGVLAVGASVQQCREETEPERQGEKPKQDNLGCNLYVSHDGENTFIATLSPADGIAEAPFGNHVSNSDYGGDWTPQVGDRTAMATPSGRDLVFASLANLTGEGAGVYHYDAVTRDLACVSCNGDGTGEGFLPITWDNTYHERWMSEDGNRVFFDSHTALLPQDTNGWPDVYEWEADGTGSCHQVAGCQYLISSGTSPAASWFIDASANGNDVFFVTRSQLLPQDGNENFDLYDARVGAPQPVSPPVCTGTGCQGVPPAPPIFATPSSVTYSGVGNFSAAPTAGKTTPAVRCKKPKRRVRGRCVKTKAKKSKKSNRRRGERRVK